MSYEPTQYGKYFLLDRIAVGGMAEVFKAKAFGVRGFERILVIKRILPHLSRDEEFVEMFVDEAKIAVELTHANICQVSDLGKIGDNYFIAMEYINGKDLRAILKKCYTAKTSLSIPQAIYVALEICKGLDYAHRKIDTLTGKPLNLIHRDISPQNIMISYHGDIKIVDFGIAKTESKLHRTQAGVLKGKFGYMSPEQAAGLELDQRTDIFSTGIILYEMLTGRRLFLGETDFETLEAIKTCNIPLPSKYRPEVSQELEQALLKALAKEREDRYEAAQDFQAALSKIFYNSYADFTTKDLSRFLRGLFKAEIDQEQETLKRAMDALPPDQVAAVTTAAEAAVDRLIEPSGEHSSLQKPKTTLPTPASDSYTKPSLFVDSVYTKTKSLFSKPWTRLIIFLLVPAALVFLFWNLIQSPKSGKTPPKPLPTPTLAVIEITSNPPGANLKLDGESKGETPLSLKLATKKIYEIQLEKPGYQAFLDQVFLSDEQTTFNFNLEKALPLHGALYVESIPPGARISYNQIYTNLSTPASIEELKLNTEHMIRVEKEGYRTQTRKVILNKPHEKILFQLKKEAITLKINVLPRNAIILVDGERRGKVIEGLDPDKTYRITARAKGYTTVTRKIKPTGSRVEVDIELKRKKINTGSISISAIPWATIIIDGEKIGPSPILNHRLPVGVHEIIFRHQDYKEVRKKIEIKSRENDPLIVDLRSDQN